MSATLNITDVFAEAVKVKVETVKPGDLVFDPMGRTYPVQYVRPFKHVVHVKRHDLDYPESFDMGSDITVIRGDA